MSIDHETGERGGVKARLEKELRDYLVVSAYLFVCFGTLLFYKFAVIGQGDQYVLHLGLAASKALILGKFVLLGEAAGIGTRLRSQSLLQAIVVEVALLVALLVVLTVIEEIILGRVHGRTLAQTISELMQHSLLEVTARCLLMMLILLPLVTVTRVSRALGTGVLRRLLLAPPARSD